MLPIDHAVSQIARFFNFSIVYFIFILFFTATRNSGPYKALDFFGNLTK